MRSLLVELLRFKNLDIGVLRDGDDYLVAAADHPVREVRMTLDQDSFLDEMLNLRYKAGAEERRASLEKLSGVVTGMLGPRTLEDLESGDDFPLQLDLVVNAAELAALPFETLRDAAGQPLLVRRERPVELTRRVRNDFAEVAARWPARPRILFAWARPEEVAGVPYEQHEAALRKALKPWMPADGTGGPLTVLPKAGIASLRKLCADSVAAEKPFTHVHVLAHGYTIGQAHRQRFGIALHDEEGELDAVPPEDLTEALAPLRGHTVVVTLATCDSANMANTITSKKSIAHELHCSGFPVVLASQLPLTVPGSNVLVERFYQELLKGRDVRMAIHEARVALYESYPSYHDWASLVGYVRLPEGYAEHLQEVRLEAEMASLRIARDRAFHPQGDDDAEVAQLAEIEEDLRQRIQRLEGFLPETKEHAREAVVLENLGLLGSAQKRLAELIFLRGKRSPGDGGWRAPMREALELARQWYQEAYEKNLSHHWTGVQYLCLDAVLAGTISHPEYWFSAVAAAKIQAKEEKEIWAYGSLAELYLLAPLVGQPEMGGDSVKALTILKERVLQLKKDDPFPIESTVCQLCRYQDWWTAANGFLPGCGTDLAAAVEPLVAALRI